MIKADEFYEQLATYNDDFKDAGYRKVRRNLYVNGDFSIKFVLNDWGWDDENGWAFYIRALDDRYTKEFGNPDYFNGSFDINPNQLKDLDSPLYNQIEKLYKQSKLLFIFRDGGWIPFYDARQLKIVLDILIRKSIILIREWKKVQITLPIVNNVKSDHSSYSLLDDMEDLFPDGDITIIK